MKFFATVLSTLLAVVESAFVLVAGLLALIFWNHRASKAKKTTTEQPKVPTDLTMAFCSTISSLTQELNLEVATTQHLESVQLEDSSVMGDNRIELKVPVTYRYHICLRDDWHLEVNGEILTVKAPRLRAARPPAIHIAQLEVNTTRGAFRLPPEDLKQKAMAQLPLLIEEFAEDERRLSMIQETAKASVRTFVRRCLSREGHLNRRFNEIEIHFASPENSPRSSSTKTLPPKTS